MPQASCVPPTSRRVRPPGASSAADAAARPAAAGRSPAPRSRRCESRPVAADGGGVEQRLTLTGVSRFAGSEEAKAMAAAMRACLHETTLEADGVRTATLRATFADVFPAGDGRRTYAVVRLRAVTEEVGEGG